MGVAPCILVAGGHDDPPYAVPADRLAPKLYALGVSPSAVRVDTDAPHTRGCADALVRAVQAHGWRRLTLVVSPYHVPRAFLATVAALDAVSLADDVYVAMLAGSATKWGDVPVGASVTRAALFDDEMAKCEQHARTGDCAAWPRALTYLRTWELRA